MQEVHKFAAYFFDLDGTVLLGEELLPGVAEALALEQLHSFRHKIRLKFNILTDKKIPLSKPFAEGNSLLAQV